MELNDKLNELLGKIRPTDAQRKNLQDAHIRLRDRLMADEQLKPLIVDTFLQGSYRRHTAIRPDGDRSDVDIVVVTRLAREDFPNPERAMDILIPFLNEYYPGKWKKKGRAIGIELSKVKMDVVIASAPSQVEEDALLQVLRQEWNEGGYWGDGNEWKTEPLWIPDREARNWQRTHPREQIRWTQEKNGLTNGHYVNVVKLVKWWWKTNHPEQDHPRSYPLEHIVGECCPDGVTSLAEAFTLTMEEFARRYKGYADLGQVPNLWDRGVPEQNVIKRLTPQDFGSFHSKVGNAASIARKALSSQDPGESASLWRSIFGSLLAVSATNRGFTPQEAPGLIKGRRFA